MNLSPTVIIWWKEIRGILPVWVGVLVAMWLPSLLEFRPLGLGKHSVLFFTYFIGSMLLAAMAYAREFHDRTMMWQLLQPVSRMSLLWRKGALLLVVLVSCGVSYMYLLSFELSFRVGTFVTVGMVIVLSLISVFFWSVLLRSVLAATVVSLIVPVAILYVLIIPLISLLAGDGPRLARPPIPVYVLTVAIFILYAAATGWAAIKLWRRMQLPGDSATVSQLDVKTTSRFTGDTSYRERAWWWALVRKEVALLRFIFWVGVVFVVGGGAYVIAERLLDHIAAGSGVQSTGSLFWWRNNLLASAIVLFSCYLALVPALCGALAFCEETHHGTRAWQLCQPAHRTGQWLIKLGVAAGLSAVFGLVLPLVVYLVAVPASSVNLSQEMLMQTVTLNVLLFSLSVWCASASRSTVMALMKSFLLVFGLFLVSQEVLGHYPLFAYSAFDWRLLAWPLSAIALAFTWPNFGRLEVPALRWVLQIGGMALLTFGFACGVALW
jgi:hypothetical protein